MSQPYQGNQFFTNVQNVSSLGVQNLNVDSLQTSNLSVGNTITLPVTVGTSLTSGSYVGQLGLLNNSDTWSINVWTGSEWVSL